MANRHLSRSLVLQALFGVDEGLDAKENPVIFLEQVHTEFGTQDADSSFMQSLFEGVLAKQNEIDAVITRAAPEWPLNRIAPIDRNILRLGLFELLYADKKEVPPKVAINEAIELAKNFSGDSSARFINGVLGAVYEEMGSPGKEDGTRRAHAKEMPIEMLSGALVYAKEEGQWFVALVHDAFDTWTLPKGGVKEGEEKESSALRAIREEMGIEAVIERVLGENEYIASYPERGKVKKRVTYFLARAPYQKLTLTPKTGIDDVRWFTLRDAQRIRFYEDLVPIITEGFTSIRD